MKIFILEAYKMVELVQKFFYRAYFRFDDETCTCWILMHFRNPVHDQWCFFFFCDFEIQKFSIFCISIYYLTTTFISFAVSVISMSNNAYFIQYQSHTIPFTYNSKIVGRLINSNKNEIFLEGFKTTYEVNLFQN